MVPARCPSHCFHTQRMQGKDKGGKAGNRLESKLAMDVGTRQSQTQQTKHDKIEEHTVHCVKKESCQVIPERVCSPQQIVEAIGHPDESPPSNSANEARQNRRAHRSLREEGDSSG